MAGGFGPNRTSSSRRAGKDGNLVHLVKIREAWLQSHMCTKLWRKDFVDSLLLPLISILLSAQESVLRYNFSLSPIATF